MTKINKKPMCDCGGELFVYTEEVHKLYKKINKDGKLSARVIDENDGDSNVYERLCCRDCGNQYWFYEDNDGVIVKDGVFDA